MKLISLKIKGFKNLDLDLDFTQSEGISVFVGNNGSGKSNVLEAISAIFYGLYTDKNTLSFDFELIYTISKTSYNPGTFGTNTFGSTTFGGGKSEKSTNKIFISHQAKNGKFNSKAFIKKINDRDQENIERYLPSQIIALYSGEETRLYENYYMDEYDNFVENIVYGEKVLQDKINMNFIDRNFWNIALLTFAIYGENFNYEEILGIPSVKEVQFDFNGEILGVFSDKIEADFYNFLKFVKNKGLIPLQELRDVNNIGVYKDFYKMLLVAMLMKKDKYRILDDIYIRFDNENGEFDAENLSEGQKKQILLYFVTTILADKDSIILLDEPDSYIHVGNKQKIQDFCGKYLIREGGGEILMTTHSPTLMHKFDKKHLFYLENGKLDLKGKREILDKITDGQMSMNEMEIFINSGNKYLLVTEGITDKKHLEIAIEKLGIENNFDIYPADSCEKLTNFLVTLPNDIFANKIIIGIYDYDDAGLKALRKLGDMIEENKKYKVSGKTNRFGMSLPYTDSNFENNPVFTIEFMYSKKVLKSNSMIEYRTVDDINRCIKNQNEKLNLSEIQSQDELYFYKVSESDTSKNSFAEACKYFDVGEFENFKVLFDLILEIK